MLGRRLISAAVIISVMLLLLTFDFWLGKDAVLGRPGLVLCLLAIVAAGMAADELIHLFRNAAATVNKTAVIGATLAMTCVMFMPVLWQDQPVNCPLGFFGWAMSGVVLALVIVFFLEMKNYDSTLSSGKGEVIDRLGRSALVFVYLSMLFGFLVPHRLLENDNSLGLIAIVGLIATVKLSDSFAYFVGKSYGTIKLAPKLSPGKTLQGSLGALVGGCVAMAIVVFVVAPLLFDVTVQKPWWWFIVYGILVTLAGMVGDLAESLLKRDSNTKDSSSWLPGLGGVLDVLDSMIFASPVSFFLWIILDTATA
ncbi:MAG: phosphatidate cytidylyltransferase [Mariniblastus sp.]